MVRTVPMERYDFDTDRSRKVQQDCLLEKRRKQIQEREKSREI